MSLLVLVFQNRSGFFKILLVQVIERLSGRGGRVLLPGGVCVLQGAELLLPKALQDQEVVGELKHVEHELLQLDAVWDGRGDGLAVDVGGDLLPGHVVRQLVEVVVADPAEEVQGEEVVADVAGAELELARGLVALLGDFLADLAVFHDLE